MIAEKQLKNDRYNIINFLKYISDIENNENIIMFLNKEYRQSKINTIFNKYIEYHSMFDNFKFDIWFLNNKEKLKNSIVFVELDKLNLLTKRHIKKLRKYSKQIIIEFSKKIKIEEVKQFGKDLSENLIIGHSNYDIKGIRKVFMLLGEKFEYKDSKKLKILAIIHTYNEEDVIETTIEYLIDQGLDICIFDNWSTDNTFKLIKEKQEKYKDRIKIDRFPKEEPKEKYYNWTSQLEKTEEVSKSLNYDWYIHYDADEIRTTPYGNTIKLQDMISFVDSIGYNAINNTVIDFRMTDEKDEIFNKNSYFEFGRRPGHFMQIKTWKKCQDIELATMGGHIANFKNQKVYPIKIINKHYPLRSLKQAEKKIYKDRLPRFEKEKKEKGWHTHYDKIAKNNDFIYQKENLNKYDEKTIEKYTLEMISGIGINKL